ncbi:MAG TPA: alpha-glucosidase C-terminal domain-containing protein [Candidatus Sulfotelmatobacter sp.]
MPVPPTYKTHNVAAESKDPDSILQFYTKVLKLRHTNPALLDGNYTPLNESDANVLSYLRIYKGEAVLVALNMSGSLQKVNFQLSHHGYASARSLLSTPKSSSSGDSVTLEPYGVFIAQLSK